MRLAVLTAGLAMALAAQEAAPPPALEYTGQPLRIPFQCTLDDIQWGGLTCSDEDPCPVYLELTAVESVGNKIFAAGNIHSASATLYSILLASDDSGRTWREPFERLRGCGLDHIQFVDFENGWASGQVLQPLPQDPFFLVTGDGGKTWRRRPVFGESRPGSILQFWFSSRANGSLIIDRGQGGDVARYELFETPNGGETWMLRETNEKPMRLKRAAANDDWRIRADAPTRSFRVERKQAERWSPLAAFSIALAGCKPPPPPPAEPPAPPQP
ncbi:MAG: WD40/YVTN/BNR-like repeat-containing protein [Bryobacteraceae bacterium]